jgi:hypothetical protein
MNCYLVTFFCSSGCGLFETYQTFFAEDVADLTEQILEYQEDMENTSDVVVITKTIKEQISRIE